MMFCLWLNQKCLRLGVISNFKLISAKFEVLFFDVLISISEPLVRNTIRSYFNLNISAHLSLYSGPVLFIRRLRDEIIITDDLHSIRTNRGNDLLTKLFQSRFPKLMADENVKSVLLQWLTNDINTQSSFSFKLVFIILYLFESNYRIF
jgi:hypothetical protein